MSVKVGDRKENKLSVIDEMRKLANYTLILCRNEKIFPKSSRWIMAKPIIEECLSAMTNMRKANAVYVSRQEDYILRRQYQMEANSSLHALLSLVDLAYMTFGIEDSKIEFWSKSILTTLEKLKAWIKSDQERYKNI